MFKNSFFKLSRNKKFNYKPRYFNKKNEKMNFLFSSRIRNDREDFDSNDRSSFWQQERIRNRIKENRSFNKLFILILFFLVFIFFYIIDFEISIFFKN